MTTSIHTKACRIHAFGPLSAIVLEDVVPDIVLDFVGGETQTRSLSVLKRGGRLVSAVSEPSQAIAGKRGVTAHFFLVAVNTSDLTSIAALFDEDRLIHNVGAVLPLAGVRAAHEMLDGLRRRPRGKIVLQVS